MTHLRAAPTPWASPCVDGGGSVVIAGVRAYGANRVGTEPRARGVDRITAARDLGIGADRVAPQARARL